MTHRLNDKVAELQHLRTQNEELERKLLNIHELFSMGQEKSGSIINGPAQPGGADHGAHEEAAARSCSRASAAAASSWAPWSAPPG